MQSNRRPVMFTTRPKTYEQIEHILLREKGWRYLRYLHLREGFKIAHAEGIETVHCLGAGKGYAELALALEFPEVRFHITDVESEITPNYHVAKGWAKRLNLPNVTFGTMDIFNPPNETWDLITSVETLEHLEDDDLAVENMLKIANRYVYMLVPFSDDRTNADAQRLAYVWDKHEHFRVGYDEKRLRALFPKARTIRGCYFREDGHKLRQTLAEMSPEEIDERAEELFAAARRDLRDEIPNTLQDSIGIWVFADV